MYIQLNFVTGCSSHLRFNIITTLASYRATFLVLYIHAGVYTLHACFGYTNQVFAVYACIIIYIFSVNQLWSLEQEPEIPGVFRIATAKVQPPLYITAPLDPKDHDLILFQARISGHGRDTQQQLWRLIPIDGTQYSRIQNYASPGKYINIPDGKSGKPLQTYKKSGDENDYYYVNLSTV